MKDLSEDAAANPGNPPVSPPNPYPTHIQIADLARQIALAMREAYVPSVMVLLSDDLPPATAIVVFPADP